MSKIHQHMNFHESQVWVYQNDREASGIIFLAGPSFWEMPEVTRRAYIPRMSMLVRVIRRRGWASLNFSLNGHFVWNDHRIEKFEKFDNSREFPMIFLYTYEYAGAACLLPEAEDHFLNRKSTLHWLTYQCQKFINIWIFMEFRFDHTKMTRNHLSWRPELLADTRSES